MINALSTQHHTVGVKRLQKYVEKLLIRVKAGAAGFEPAIPGLGGRCIIQAILRARPILRCTVQDRCAYSCQRQTMFLTGICNLVEKALKLDAIVH